MKIFSKDIFRCFLASFLNNTFSKNRFPFLFFALIFWTFFKSIFHSFSFLQIYISKFIVILNKNVLHIFYQFFFSSICIFALIHTVGKNVKVIYFIIKTSVFNLSFHFNFWYVYRKKISSIENKLSNTEQTKENITVHTFLWNFHFFFSFLFFTSSPTIFSFKITIFYCMTTIFFIHYNSLLFHFLFFPICNQITMKFFHFFYYHKFIVNRLC